MHTFRLLASQDDLDRYLVPILETNGSEVPPKGCYAAAVEFDESGQVVAYQMLQNAVFLEGLWAKEPSAQLLRLYRMATKYATDVLGAGRIMTMTRNDDSGNKIGRIAEHLGMEKMNWNIFRRKL